MNEVRQANPVGRKMQAMMARRRTQARPDQVAISSGILVTDGNSELSEDQWVLRGILRL